MPPRDEAFYRTQIVAICNDLLKAGWISEFFVHEVKGAYGIKWTAKGRERSQWVNQIGDELELGPDGMCALLLFCGSHAPKD